MFKPAAIFFIISTHLIKEMLTTRPTSGYDVTNIYYDENYTATEYPPSVGSDESIFEDKIPLYIAGFYTSGEIWDGTGMIPAIELAVDHVNANIDILDDYEVHVIWKNSKCRSSDGVWAFHRHLVEKPQKMMFLGPACSTAAQPVARTSHLANLLTISYSASSPSLSDRAEFPYFFRTYPSETYINAVHIWLLQYFNWRRFGSFLGNHNSFISNNNHLREALQEKNITLEVSEIIHGMPTARQLEVMKENDLRVFITALYEDTALELFCRIYQHRLFGKGYVWILPGWYSDQWWKRNITIDGCTSDEIETAVVESMYISAEPVIISSSETLVSGMPAKDFEKQFLEKKRQLESSGLKVTTSGFEPFGYDALFAVAISLNQSVDILRKQGRRLEEFTYNNAEIGSVIFQAMDSLQFLGVTGPVSFSAGDRQDPIDIHQLQGSCREGWILFQFYCYKFINETSNWQNARQHCQNLEDHEDPFMVSILSEEEFEFIGTQIDEEWLIGLTYDRSLEKLIWADAKREEVHWLPSGFDERDAPCYVWKVGPGEWRPIDCTTSRPFICKMRPDFQERSILTISPLSDTTWHGQFMWHDDMVPLDRTPAVEVGLTNVAYAVLCSFSLMGIVIAICFLAFNLSAREHKFVKLSSPRLNNLIVIGCIMIYLSVCVLGSEVVKQDGERVLFNGFCMLRIWLVSIGFVLGFGTMFSKTWRVYKVATIKEGGKRLKIKDSQLFVMVGIFLLIDLIIILVWQVVDPLHHQKSYLDFGHYVFTCDCKNLTIWTGILVIYKGVILIFGVFLAWQTRHVTIPALNDSKLIGICVYNTMVLCVIGVTVSVAFPKKISFQYIMLSSIMNFCATFTLITIFLPKIIFVYKYPKADRKVSSSSQNCHSSPNITTDKINGTDQSDNTGRLKTTRNTLKQYLENLAGYGQREIYNMDCEPNVDQDADANHVKKRSITGITKSIDLTDECLADSI